MFSRIKNFARFGREENGNATIEFVFLFPLFMSIFLMGFESGFYMIRNVMLERGVDIAVRNIRLGNGKIPSYDAVREQICDSSLIFPNCDKSIHIWMEEIAIAPGAIAAVEGGARCLNQFSEDPQFDDTDYDVGKANTMMVVQVCASVTPFFPTTGIGLGLKNDKLGGQMAIVASTAFVNEPGTRAVAPDPVPMGGGA